MKQELDNILQDLNEVKLQLITDIADFYISSSSLKNSELWFNSAEGVTLSNSDNKLIINTDIQRSKYISYIEKNNSYSILPKNDISIFPNEDYSVEVLGIKNGKIKVEIIVIEYSDSEKLIVHSIPLNKEFKFKTHPQASKLRVAMKLIGTGSLEINNFNLKLYNTKPLRKKVVIKKTNKKNEYKSFKQLKVACIFDEFTTTCYEKMVELIPIGINSWESQIEETLPDLLMVESAWRGNGGQWDQKIAKYSTNDYREIKELINFCKEKGIPTVFWNKEDPIHYEKFIGVAKLFDYIFTTDADRIPDYKRDANNQNVDVLMFSAEPSLHNPIKIADEREKNISFAGSYYGNRHAERKHDMDEILDLALKHNLIIYDRNYEKNLNSNSMFKFPEKFNDYIRPSLKYSEIDKAYKGHKLMLNVNSVKHSPTMFSRRVFEGLACGTPIISSYSLGISKVFGDLVLLSKQNTELEILIQKINSDSALYDQYVVKGIREVHLKHTYKKRLEKILNLVGIHVNEIEPTVMMFGYANSAEEFDKILSIYNKQTYNHKKLTIMIDYFEGYKDYMNQYNTECISTQLKSYTKNFKYMNECMKSKYDFVSLIQPQNNYGQNYILDLILASEYSKADIVGKSAYFKIIDGVLQLTNEDNQYEYVDRLNFDESMVSKQLIEKIEINAFNENSLELTNRFFKQGYRLFSIDKYNFVKNDSKDTIENLHL